MISRSNGRAHDHGAVVPEHRDNVVGIKPQPAEQVVKVGKADRAGDHAEEAAVFARDAAAEHDGVGAVMQHRAADEQARGPAGRGEPRNIPRCSAVFRQRVERRGIDGQFSRGIEHLDRAEMPGGRDAIEQDQLPQGLADVVDLRRHHVVGDRTQRKIVQLDVTADIGVDAGGQIFERLARQLLFAVAHVEHHVDADRREADYRDNGTGDQQFC